MALSYDPTKIPYPATNDQQFLNAILVELRAIRIALEKQNNHTPVVTTMSTPVVTKAPRK